MFFRALFAEFLKTRRTLALILTLIAPAVIVFFVSGFYYQRPDSFLPVGKENPWNQYFQMIMVYWNLLLLPLFITLETGLLANLEHGQKNWKLLYAQPIPRWTIYAAKLVVMMLWMILCQVLVILLLFAGGGILQLINPEFGFTASIPWENVLRLSGLSYLASFFMMAFHLWVASRWQSFVVAMGAGIVAAIATVFLFGEEIASFFPWAIPGSLVMDTFEPAWLGIMLAIGLGGGVLTALLAMVNLQRQEIQ